MKSELKLAGTEKAKIIARDGHSISRKDIAPNALKVLYRLTSAGYHAYIVGGGIRDLMLQKKPKDFDVATDAAPEEVKNLFRNGRIIGRRFKIVHVRFGKEIIEVTTFRADHARSNEISNNPARREIKGLDSAHSESGLILRDNVYGNIDEDAMRRDFTVNALYYTTDGFRVLDFCSGIEDLKAKKIRIIGNPVERYKEDPVRMLRAIRFSAKLNFTIEENTQKPIDELSYLLDSISSARLFDETLKLMTGGYAEKTFEMLRQFQLGTYLFAPTLEALSESDGSPANLVFLALKNTDDRLANGKSVTPAFLFASLLWPVLKLHLAKSKNLGLPPQKAFQQAAQSAISEQLHYTAIPKRFTLATREIWELQEKLKIRTKRNVDKVFNNSRFRAAYDFLLLREDSGEDLKGLGQWWTDFQVSDSETKLRLIATANKSQNRHKGKKRLARGHGE
jgi:poly(A) polymerase